MNKSGQGGIADTLTNPSATTQLTEAQHVTRKGCRWQIKTEKMFSYGDCVSNILFIFAMLMESSLPHNSNTVVSHDANAA